MLTAGILGASFILGTLFFLTPDKHKIVQKKCKHKTYKIKNSFGVFSVCRQTHWNYDEEGIASFYNSGHTTSTTDKFNPNYLTAAHPFLPLPCVAEVSLISDPNKKIIVKINDRGPFTKQKRIIDLSYKAAQKLGIIEKGIAKVRVRVLKKATKQLKEHGGKLDWKGDRNFPQQSKKTKSK